MRADSDSDNLMRGLSTSKLKKDMDMLGSNDLLGGIASDEPLGLGGKKHGR